MNRRSFFKGLLVAACVATTKLYSALEPTPSLKHFEPMIMDDLCSVDFYESPCWCGRCYAQRVMLEHFASSDRYRVLMAPRSS